MTWRVSGDGSPSVTCDRAGCNARVECGRVEGERKVDAAVRAATAAADLGWRVPAFNGDGGDLCPKHKGTKR